MIGWVRRRNEPPTPPANLAPEDGCFYPTVSVPKGCGTCSSMPDNVACPICWGVAYLVHPSTFRGQEGDHWYACQACRQEETQQALREQGFDAS